MKNLHLQMILGYRPYITKRNSNLFSVVIVNGKFNAILPLKSFSCQFLVREDGDYTVHNFDPDVLVHWDNIEQVVNPN